MGYFTPPIKQLAFSPDGWHNDIMSSRDLKSKRRSINEVRKIIAKVVNTDGPIVFTDHARARMVERKVSTLDITNVLKAQNLRVHEGELSEKGYSYKCTTNKFMVAIAISYDSKGLIIVTVARVERISV